MMFSTATHKPVTASPASPADRETVRRQARLLTEIASAAARGDVDEVRRLAGELDA
jgi:hypothetical protein